MKKITTDELKKFQQLKERFLLVNVLPAESFAETEIPGAVNIPLEEPEFLSRVEQASGGKAKTVVTYCAHEECPASADAARKLEDAGFTNVFAYEAGAKGWKEAGAAVKTGAKSNPAAPAFKS
jgi:rhodanese-related sulfurtransferase